MALLKFILFMKQYASLIGWRKDLYLNSSKYWRALEAQGMEESWTEIGNFQSSKTEIELW